MKFKIRKTLGLPLKDFKISFIDPSFLFENKIEVVRSKEFKDNKAKEFDISVKSGAHIVRIESNKSVYERLIENDGNIVLPLFFDLFRKDLSLDQFTQSQITEKYRWDKDKCYLCKASYKGMLTVFKCKYCEKHFCEKHRIPEDHKCSGKPTLPKDMRQHFESWTFPKGN